MSKELKIEVGKLYRTKGGKKARIYATDGNDSNLIHGAVLGERGWEAFVWPNNGKAVINDNNSIISEWQEPLDFNPFDLPSWAKWIAMGSNRHWYFYMEKPESYEKYYYSDDEAVGFIPPKVAPKNYQGKWEDSLFNVEELKKQYKAEKV